MESESTLFAFIAIISSTWGVHQVIVIIFFTYLVFNIYFGNMLYLVIIPNSHSYIAREMLWFLFYK